jgi:hypothetical protein
MTAAVYVSFPVSPDAYPANPDWHAQLCFFVFQALRQRFGDRVVFYPWETPPPLRSADALVTFLPHPALVHWKRSVLVDNETFDVDKWRHAAFRRFGYNARVSRVAHHDQPLARQFHRIVLCNDVILRRIETRDSRVAERWDYLNAICDGRITVHPHPIDKAFFGRLYNTLPVPDRARMLVYHGGWRKNSAELIELLRRTGFVEEEDFAIVKYIDKRDDHLVRYLLQKFFFVGNASFSESGPINMWEYLSSGHIVYGHEDWWDGAGNLRLCWSYDPARMEENAANLDFLLRGMSREALVAERDRLWRWWMERTDNEWGRVTDDVGDQVDKLLRSSHPPHYSRDQSVQSPIITLSDVPLRCCADGTGTEVLLHGWSQPEEWGTWSVWNKAAMRFCVKPLPERPIALEIFYRSFLQLNHPKLHIKCNVGHHDIAEWECTLSKPTGLARLLIPVDVIGRSGEVELNFTISTPRSPAALGVSSDWRALGIGVEWIRASEV